MKQLALKCAAILLASGHPLGAAFACDLQRGNEVYLDARDEVSRLGPAEKARIAQDWSELETEQKSLWALAGQIDEECRKGELSPELVPYNARVYDWQDRLRRFLKRLHSPSENPSAKPDPDPVSPPPAAAPPAAGAAEIDFPSASAPKPTPTPKPAPIPKPPAPAPAGQPLDPPALL